MTLPIKILLGLLSFAIAAYLSACLWLYLWQTRMIFFPAAAIETTPADFGADFEQLWIPVGTAEQLQAWWIPASGTETGVMLYLHGNAANIGANAEQANRFRQLGLSVLLIDYRGYGNSQGEFPSEQQVYEDAEASWQYLTQIRQVPPPQLLLYGHSLGGAIAINLALQHPDAAGLIVQSSFTSMRQMVDDAMPHSIFPIDLLLTQKFDSIEKVAGLNMPLLYIHGLEDQRVPAAMSQALYEASPDPKQLYLVPEASHNNVAQVAGLKYLKIIQQFVQQHLSLERV